MYFCFDNWKKLCSKITKIPDGRGMKWPAPSQHTFSIKVFTIFEAGAWCCCPLVALQLIVQAVYELALPHYYHWGLFYWCLQKLSVQPDSHLYSFGHLSAWKQQLYLVSFWPKGNTNTVKTNWGDRGAALECAPHQILSGKKQVHLYNRYPFPPQMGPTFRTFRRFVSSDVDKWAARIYTPPPTSPCVRLYRLHQIWKQ